MFRTLPVLAAFVVLLSALVAHGLWTNRWQDGAELERAAARLERVPMNLGDWEGARLQMSSREQELAGLTGYVMRRYRNRLNGDILTVTLLCGRPGPLSAHTPEVCYPGAGFEMTGSRSRSAVRWESGARTAEFWTADFHKGGPAATEHLRIFWAWSAAGDWAAPENPRPAFGGAPVLYKVYVARRLDTANEPAEDDPALRFLKRLLPELQKVITGPP
jgi:hypothetical protein